MLEQYVSVSLIQTRIFSARALLVTLETSFPSLDTAFSQPVYVHRTAPACGAAFGELEYE
jgi:hypothetical protein